MIVHDVRELLAGSTVRRLRAADAGRVAGPAAAQRTIEAGR